jgi:hypothetical protein
MPAIGKRELRGIPLDAVGFTILLCPQSALSDIARVSAGRIPVVVREATNGQRARG